MKDLCLFAHFDRDDKVDAYVLRYLQAIRELGFSIVFISASELSTAAIEFLNRLCNDVILRANAGLDFGSWSAGLAKHGSNFSGRLLLANDSVYGPIGSLASAFNRLTATPADFYGFIESSEHIRHLQSWFLLFEPWVVQSLDFRKVFSQPFSTMTKERIIQCGELQLTEQLVKAGFSYNALYLTNRAGMSWKFFPVNVNQIFWRELLLYEKIPFLKVALVRDDPIKLQEYGGILSVVRAIDPSWCDVIEDHLGRSALRSPTKCMSSLRRWANRLRVTLLREGYRLSRTRSRRGEILNFMKLLAVMGLFSVGRTVLGRQKELK